ncbi:hypothetical protein EEW87_004285 [Janibacter melonis]|uniref:Recombination endonuclease VII n=1 Tax=Janibacter melonis TaxID=262209 RepID=A0A5P8FJL9_9MICO|nr:hypothetical protein EEW87_004285 [Janibacter melonis]
MSDITVQTKSCNKCGELKPLEGFCKNRASQDGRNSRCRECVSLYNSARYTDPAYRASELQRSAARRATSPTRNARPDNPYPGYQHGLVLGEYELLAASQQGLCAICREPETAIDHHTGRPRRLAIDHDHKHCPGRFGCQQCIRGLICGRCNNGLGRFRDDPDRLRAAAKYLESFERS